MSATSITDESQPEELIDDVSKETKPSEDVVDMSKLAALKAKSKAQQENTMAAKIVAKKERSLVLGIIGTGQAGSRIAESFYKLSCSSIIYNN